MKKIIILILVMLELSVYFGDNFGKPDEWEDGNGKHITGAGTISMPKGKDTSRWYKNIDFKTPMEAVYILNGSFKLEVNTIGIWLRDPKSNEKYPENVFAYYSNSCGDLESVDYYENGKETGGISTVWNNKERSDKEYIKKHPDYEKDITYPLVGNNTDYLQTYMKSFCKGSVAGDTLDYDRFTKSQWEARMSEPDREEWVYIKNAGVTGVGASLDHHLRIRALYLFRDNVVRRKAFKNSVCNWIDEDVIYDEKGNEVKRYSYDHVGGELKITDGGKVVKEKINKKVCEGMAERPADNRINSLVKSFFDMNKKYNIKTYKSITSEEEFEYKP